MKKVLISCAIITFFVNFTYATKSEVLLPKEKSQEVHQISPISSEYLVKIFQQEFFQEKVVESLADLSSEVYEELSPIAQNLLQYIPALLMNKNNGEAVLVILDDIVSSLKTDHSEEEILSAFTEIPPHTKAAICNLIASCIKYTGREQNGFANAHEIMRLAGYIKKMTPEECSFASQYNAAWIYAKNPEARACSLPKSAFEHLGKYEKVMLYSNIFCILRNCDELWGTESRELVEDLKTVILPYRLERLSSEAKASLFCHLLDSGALRFYDEMKVFYNMFFTKIRIKADDVLLEKPIMEEISDIQRINLLQRIPTLSSPSQKPLFNADETPTELLLGYLKDYVGYLRRDFSSILQIIIEELLPQRHYRLYNESLRSLRILNNIFDVETGSRRGIFESLINKRNKAWLEFQFGCLLKEFGFLKKSKEVLQRLKDDAVLMPELSNWSLKFFNKIISCDWSRIDSSKNEEAVKFLIGTTKYDESKRIEAYENLERAKEEYEKGIFSKNTTQRFFNADLSGTNLYGALLLTDKILARFYHIAQITRNFQTSEVINLSMPLFMLSIDETPLISMIPEKYHRDIAKAILEHWRNGFKIELLPLPEQSYIRQELIRELREQLGYVSAPPTLIDEALQLGMVFFDEKDGKLVGNRLLELLPYLRQTSFRYDFSYILERAKKYKEMSDVLEAFYDSDEKLNYLVTDLANSENFVKLTLDSDLREYTFEWVLTNQIKASCFLRQYEKALNIFKNIFDIDTGEKILDIRFSSIYEAVEEKQLFIYVLQKCGRTGPIDRILKEIKEAQDVEGYYDDDISEESETEKEPKPNWWE